MARKEKEQLNTKPLPELMKELSEQKQKLVDLKFDLSAGKVKNIKEIRKIKKMIARILTAVHVSTRH